MAMAIMADDFVMPCSGWRNAAFPVMRSTFAAMADPPADAVQSVDGRTTSMTFKRVSTVPPARDSYWGTVMADFS